MLISNKFQKHCFLLYSAVFPAFFFFIFTFQTKVMAQETADESIKKGDLSSSEFTITSASTDEEISEKVAFFSNEYDLLLNIKKVNRNSNGEINGIKIVFSNKKGAKEAYNVSDAEPIDPIRIYVNVRDNNKITFGFGDADSSLDSEENSVEQKSEIVAEAAEIKAEDTRSMEQSSELLASTSVTSSGDDDISLIKQDPSMDYKKAFISLDGKEISADEMELINPKTIGSVTKMNGANNDRLVEKYGERARNGVIAIETIVVLQELTTDQISNLPENYKLDAVNGAFIIHKNSKESDLQFYEKKLAQIGVRLEISDLERNTAGVITNLKLKLNDDLQNVQMSDWIRFKNSNGIINIVVGRKNGKVSVYSQ